MMAIVGVFALLLTIDVVAGFLSVPILLSRKMSVILPIFVSGVLFYTLALIERQYREEKAAREKMESDLTLARDIQDSLSPPAEHTVSERLRVACYQIKHEKVGGDWTALRGSPSGELAVVVADATGKGVQAALVIHAVQSLWADALGEATFDPKLWLERVNRALHRLGETKPHSLTMGVTIVGADEVTYWSAGHVPMFAVVESAGKRHLTSLTAKGSVLGIGNDIEVQPAVLSLAGVDRLDLLLGSDGVFANGSRTKRRELDDFYERVLKEGAASLKSCPAEDDKTLVRISWTAA
jgi:sigma-B regulation protein RsbU (phosphoserine phosphatase)